MNGYIKILKTIKDLLISVAFKKPILFGFDITNKCTLGCPMCYWKSQRNPGELYDDEVIELVKNLKIKKALISLSRQFM